MSKVQNKNTTPELRVRSLLHSLGYRFRLHRRDLPGTPDLVLPKHRLCIFVHGCFWHQHPFCRRATVPSSRRDFWLEKFSKNANRDAIAQAALKAQGWRVIVIWECQTKCNESLTSALVDLLES